MKPLEKALTNAEVLLGELENLREMLSPPRKTQEAKNEISFSDEIDRTYLGKLQRLRRLRHRNTSGVESAQQDNSRNFDSSSLHHENSAQQSKALKTFTAKYTNLSFAVCQQLECTALLKSLRELLLQSDNENTTDILQVIEGAGPIRDLPTNVQDEVSLIRREVLDRTAIDRLKVALTSHAAKGTVKNIDMKNISVHLLESAIQYADSVQCESELARDLLGTAISCRKMRLAIMQEDHQSLRFCLDKICVHPVGFEIIHSELCLVQDILDNHSCAEILRSGLRHGRIMGEPGHLINVAENHHNSEAVSRNEDTPLQKKYLSTKHIGELKVVGPSSTGQSDTYEHRKTYDEASTEHLRQGSDVVHPSHFYRDDMRSSSAMSSISTIDDNMNSGISSIESSFSMSSACSSEVLHKAIAQTSLLKEKTKEVSALLIIATLVARLRDALRVVPTPDWSYAKRLCLHARGKTATSGQQFNSSDKQSNGTVITLQALGGKELPAPITEEVLSYLGHGDTRLVLAEIELVENDISIRKATKLLRDALQTGQATCMMGSINVSTIDLSHIDAAISNAQSAGLLVGEGRSLLLTAILLRKMRAALLNGPDWQTVRAAIERLEEPETFDLVLEIGKEPYLTNNTASTPSRTQLRGVHPLVANEVSAVRKEVQLHFETRDLLLKVIFAAEQKDLVQLKDALSNADQLGMHSSSDLSIATQIARAKVLAERLGEAHVRLQEALDVFNGIMSEREYARRRGYSNDEERVGKWKTADVDQKRSLNGFISTSFSFVGNAGRSKSSSSSTHMSSLHKSFYSRRNQIDESRPDILRRALKHAARVGYDHSDLARTVQGYLDRMNELEQLAKDACAHVNIGMIQRVLEQASAHLEWQTWDVKGDTSGYRMRNDNGAEPGRPCPMLTRETQTMCRQLLALPKHQLQQVRLNNAIKSKDIDRIVDATMDIKKTFFDETVQAMPKKSSVYVDDAAAPQIPDVFRLEKLPCLRSKTEYTSERFIFQSTPINDSLSIISGSMEETENRRIICVKMFKNVMGFMCDRKYSYPETLGRELLEAGLLHHALRDELYLQILKQLSRNPNDKSKYLGFVLLELCLQSFPPSSILENALEYFLRSEKATVLVRQLHKIVYLGALGSIDELPSESAIAKSHKSAVLAAKKPTMAKNRWSKLRSWAQTDVSETNKNKNLASINWDKISNWVAKKSVVSTGNEKDSNNIETRRGEKSQQVRLHFPSNSFRPKTETTGSAQNSSTPKPEKKNSKAILTTPEVATAADEET